MKKVIDSAVRLIDKTLDTRITPLAYVYAITGVIWGFAFTFINQFPSASTTTLAANGALIGVQMWGVIVLVASVVLITSMFLKVASLVQIAAFVMVIAWGMAGGVYISTHDYFRLSLAVVSLLCYGYLYLASALGRLWDYTPDR